MDNEIEIKVVDNTVSTPPSKARRRETKKRVFLVPGIVLANFVIFIVTMYVNDCPKNSNSCVVEFFGRFSFKPKNNTLLQPTSATLEKMGGLDMYKVSHQHQVWRLFTCIWLHVGVDHILSNMLSLIFIGIWLEREFGIVLVGLLYVLTGFGGSLSSALLIQLGVSVGASGAIFGLLGSMLSELITNWSIHTNKVVRLLILLFIVIFSLASGIHQQHVDNFAHLGGFTSGFLLGFVFLIRPQNGWVNQRRVDMNDHCSWCHYLIYVPTSKWSCSNSKASCQLIQTGNHLNMTCSSNGRSEMYSLSNNSAASKLQQLCCQLCS
ncbi:hypothetical protein ACFE04_012149 [Oxalis oulophora]